MKKPRFPSARTRRDRRAARGSASRGGFTLVELLVAMAVLVLIIAMLTLVVGNATSSIQRSTKGIDSNRAATVALDRIGESIAGMITRGEGTLVAIKNASGSDGLAMIANERVRSRAPSSANVSVDTTRTSGWARGGFASSARRTPTCLPRPAGEIFPRCRCCTGATARFSGIRRA